jgi:hypothetical protein
MQELSGDGDGAGGYGQGERMCVCCREISKRHEEIWRGSVRESVLWLQGQARADSQQHSISYSVSKDSCSVNHSDCDSDSEQRGPDLGLDRGSGGDEDSDGSGVASLSPRTNAVSSSGRVRGEFTIVLEPLPTHNYQHDTSALSSSFMDSDDIASRGNDGPPFLFRDDSSGSSSVSACEVYLRGLRDDGVGRSEAVKLVTEIMATTATDTGVISRGSRRNGKLTKSEVYKIALNMKWK